MRSKLSTKNAVTLENVDGVDYLYFVDAETKQTLRLPLSVLLEWITQEGEFGGGGTPDAHAASHATGGTDPITPGSIGAATTADLAAVAAVAAGAATDAANAAGAIAEHAESAENPHEVTAAQVGAIPVTEGGAGYVPITTAEGTLDTDDALTFDGTTLNAPGLYVGSDGVYSEGDVTSEGTVSAGGVYSEGDIESEGTVTAGEITTSGSVAADVGMTIAGRAVEVASSVAATHSATVLTLTAAHHNQRIPVDTSSNSVEVRIVDTLPAGFSCELRKTSAANAITYASGGGYITPVPYGTSDALNAITSIFVESASHAETITVEPS